MVHVIEEANRCLQCKKPMCMTGCPISTEIPHMIKLFKEGKVKDAGQMLFENNPLSIDSHLKHRELHFECCSGYA